LAGWLLLEWRKEAVAKKLRRAEKFEELVAALYDSFAGKLHALALACRETSNVSPRGEVRLPMPIFLFLPAAISPFLISLHRLFKSTDAGDQHMAIVDDLRNHVLDDAIELMETLGVVTPLATAVHVKTRPSFYCGACLRVM